MATMTVTEARPVETTVKYDSLGPDEIYKVATASLYRDRPVNVKPVIVNDVRGHEAEFSLKKQGFEVHKHNMAFSDYADDEKIKSVWWPMVIELLKERTGATKVVPFSHMARTQTWEHAKEVAKEGSDLGLVNVMHPERMVHIDQAPAGAPIMATNVFKDAWPEMSKSHWGIINVWQPISPVIRKDPLGLIDRTTVDYADLVPKVIRYPEGRERTSHIATADVKHQICAIAYNPKHKWYYVNEMKPDEVLFIRIFDSETPEGESTGTPHASFIDQKVEGEPTRQSIELRCIVFWEDEAAA